jgi:hypothetical protein
MSDLLRDVRHAVRRLGQSSGFTAVAVLTLALSIAIAATSAIFTVVDAVILGGKPAVGCVGCDRCVECLECGTIPPAPVAPVALAASDTPVALTHPST